MTTVRVPEYHVDIYMVNPSQNQHNRFTSRREAMEFARWHAVGDYQIHVSRGSELIAYRDANETRFTHCK